MSFVRFPQFAEAANLAYLSARIRDTAKRARAVLTISHFSAAEISDVLGIPADRVFAIHPGISGEFRAPPPGQLRADLAALGLARPYLLTVGTLEPRKNIPLAIEMFERMPRFDGELVIAGMKGWKCDPILERMRASSRAASIRHLEYVADTQLPSLYAGASLFVFPSFYEGFGFPPLEAMACGTPVLSSNGGSLPEALGDAAVILNPAGGEQWAVAAGKLLGDSDARQALVERGRQQVARYAWADAARRTWDVYRTVAERGAP